jgi:hypothetical protein
MCGFNPDIGRQEMTEVLKRLKPIGAAPKYFWIVVGSVVGIGMFILFTLVFRPKSPVPDSVRGQVTFSIIIPREAEGIQLHPDSIVYDERAKLLSYAASIYGVEAIVSEQPTPESFIDIPEVYTKVVASMQEYAKFESEMGTVYLTKPTNLGGKQAAVTNSKGVLMFVKPARDLTEDQWRRFFLSLYTDR